MASSSAQGQEDVATAARTAVRGGPFHDLAVDPRRSDAVARDRHQAGPRPPRASRRRGHAAVPGPRRGRQHEPHRAGRIRAPRRRAAERAAGSPDHGVLPGRADAPLRPFLPAVRGQQRRRSGARATRPDLRLSPARSGSGPGPPSARCVPSRARSVGIRGVTEHTPGHDPDSPSTIRVSGQRTPASGAPAFAIPGVRDAPLTRRHSGTRRCA